MKPKCEARGCNNDADWAFIGEGGDLYLCAFHGGSEPVEGWTWIGADHHQLEQIAEWKRQADLLDRLHDEGFPGEPYLSGRLRSEIERLTLVLDAEREANR